MDKPSSDCRGSFSLHRLQREQVLACCSLEAICFNKLRRDWHQPLQEVRRSDWLGYHVQHYPENCIVAMSGDEVIGFCMVHIWGSLGWLGPVVVDGKCQGQGLGRVLVRWSLDRMKMGKCSTIGLETWPYHMHNIGLYITEGFLPGPLTVVLEKSVKPRNIPFLGERVHGFDGRAGLIHALAALSGSILPGLDYRPMLETLTECEMGEVLIWKQEGQMIASACLRWKAYTEAPDPSFAVLEMLTIKPGEEGKLEEILVDIESLVANAGRTSLHIQLSSQYGPVLFNLVNKLGYQLHKTRLRMLAWQQPIRENAINFSSFAV